MTLFSKVKFIVFKYLKLVLILGLKYFAKALRIIFPTKLQVEHLTLQLPNLKTPNNEAIIMVQISDIHYDHHPIRITDDFLKKVVDTINILNADICVITGDLVQCDPEPIKDLLDKHLSKINTKYGVYSILGNHDYKKENGASYIKNVLDNSKVKLLVNEVVYPFGRGEGKLQLVGLGDMNKRRNDFNLEPIREQLSIPDIPRVVLSHNPDSHSKFNEFNVDLILSGHTHGGQVCLPSGKPLIPFLDRAFKKLPKSLLSMASYPHGVVEDWSLASGLKLLKTISKDRLMQIYINKGLATHPPLRLFCDPEITVITLIPTTTTTTTTGTEQCEDHQNNDIIYN